MIGIPSPSLIAAGVIAGMVAIGGAYLKGEAAGRTRSEAAVQAARAEERDRQARANAVAKTFEAMIIARNIAVQKDLERQLRELSNAADSDADAGGVGMSHDGVRRHNAIATGGKGQRRPAARPGGQ